MSIRFESQCVCIYTVCEMHYLHPPQSCFSWTDVWVNKSSHCALYIFQLLFCWKMAYYVLSVVFPWENRTLSTPHSHSASPIFSQTVNQTPEKKTTPSLLKKQDVKRKTEGERGIKKKKRAEVVFWVSQGQAGLVHCPGFPWKLH